MALTKEQFIKLRNQGLSIDQIVGFENRKKPTQPIQQKTSAELSAEGFKPTFPATEKETIISAPLKTIGNIPSSAVQFAKGIVGFLNPVNTVRVAKTLGEEIGGGIEQMGGKKLAIETIKGLPKAAYDVVATTFIKNLINGDIEEAQKTIINDPVGQIAPFILIGKAVANKTGKGAAFDKAMTDTASIVTKPVNYVASKAGQVVSKVGTAGLGVSTGAGPQAFKEAYASGQKGLKGTPFSEALRGKTSETEIVNTAIEAQEALVNKRAAIYASQLKKIGKDTTVIDDTPIRTELNNQLKNFRITIDDKGKLDFSKSPIRNTPEAVSDITTIVEDIRRLGTSEGLDKTPIGLNDLKIGIDSLYSPTGRARAFVSNMTGAINKTLKKEVPNYETMTSEYGKSSALLKEFKRSLALGGTSGTEAIWNRLTRALREDNNFRLELTSVLEEIGKKELTQQVAGKMLEPLAAKGLVGRSFQYGSVGGVFAGLLSPKILIGLVMTSPRLAGEFVHALGFGATKTNALLKVINELRIPEITSIKQKQ